MVEWIIQQKDEGRKTKVKGSRTKGQGQRTKDQIPRPKSQQPTTSHRPPSSVYRHTLLFTCCAMRCATAMIVSIGLTPEGVGKVEASATNKRRTSQLSPFGSTTDCERRLPIRHVPI